MMTVLKKPSFQGFESADSVPYDVEYTLRLLAENGLGRESVLLYCLLGQLEAAVGIALVGQIWQLCVRLERICCSLGHRLTLPKCLRLFSLSKIITDQVFFKFAFLGFQ